MDIKRLDLGENVLWNRWNYPTKRHTIRWIFNTIRTNLTYTYRRGTIINYSADKNETFHKNIKKIQSLINIHLNTDDH